MEPFSVEEQSCQLFSKLAEEELIHNNRLERGYHDIVLKED